MTGLLMRECLKHKQGLFFSFFFLKIGEEANDAKDVQTLDICQLHLKIIQKPTSNKEIRKSRKTRRAPHEFQSH